MLEIKFNVEACQSQMGGQSMESARALGFSCRFTLFFFFERGSRLDSSWRSTFCELQNICKDVTELHPCPRWGTDISR